MESEALKYYYEEVKDTPTDADIHLEEEIQPQNEAEEAVEFLQHVGLAILSKEYHQGKEITDKLVNDSVRQRNLTEKQAQTIRSRVRTLNKTVKNRQARRKQRQDIRDISWNLETSSTGTRSRSATPDSLDSSEALNEHTNTSSDDDQQPTSLPPLILDHGSSNANEKTKIKWTSSEPLQNKKFNRVDRGDIAHLGSNNVVLKGYQPLNEYATLAKAIPKRERSGSDPTAAVDVATINTNIVLKNDISVTRHQSSKLHNQLSRSHNTIPIQIAPVTINNNCTKVYLNSNETNDEDQVVSFESLVKQNDYHIEQQSATGDCLKLEDGILVDELSDSEYQYLKPLLYVELISIFDSYDIKCLKRKASIKNKGGNVFGLKLASLVMRDMPIPTDNSMVPKVFQTVIAQLNSRCLREDGILRIAGQKQKLETLCQEIESKFFNNRKEVEQLLCHASVHDLTGVLKKLLRDLPDPIFTMELFDMFYKTSAITKTDDKIKALNLLVLMLPIEHRNTFRLLLELFLNIISHEQDNRMSLHNVAMISAPSFFPPRLLLPKDNKILNKQMTKEELVKQINGAALCCAVMETMLKAGLNLWRVPKHLAVQAREDQKRAQDRKDMSKDKKIHTTKIKLGRSNTQYEPGVMNGPRIKRDLFM